MPTPKDRFTATLSELRPREIRTRRPGRIALQVRTPDGPREVVVDESRVTIGAHEASGIVVKDDAVSKLHCELRLADEELVLRDLGSKNGTWLGNVRVHEVCLPPGTSFTLGECTVTVRGIDNVEIPISTADHFGQLYGRGPKMGELFAQLERLSTMPFDVLVMGETGTGKDLIARGLHEPSERRDGPFVVVDCTTLNEGIAESILFGHRRGTFTGAQDDHVGLLEQAHGGTLFFDEIGELPSALQPKLLRALEQRGVRRIGETEYRPIDMRIVAATNRDLLHMVGEGEFREDLYFRLAQVTLRVPPLRDRGRGDITLLADLFLAEFSRRRGFPLEFDKSAYEAFTGFSWPGNVRQLRNAVKVAAMWTEHGQISDSDLPALEAMPAEQSADEDNPPFQEIEKILRAPLKEARKMFERIYISRVLETTGGNQSEAARRPGMSRSAFRELPKRLPLTRWHSEAR